MQNAHMSRLCLAGFVEGCGSLKENSQSVPCAGMVLAWFCRASSQKAGFPELPGLCGQVPMWPVLVTGILLWINCIALSSQSSF